MTAPIFPTTLGVSRRYFTNVNSWYKDGIEMDIGATNGRIAIYPNGLHLKEPKRSDTGIYQAKASNALGTVFSEHIKLTVLGGFLY